MTRCGLARPAASISGRDSAGPSGPSPGLSERRHRAPGPALSSPGSCVASLSDVSHGPSPR